jgi:hypothetical protein
MLWVGLTVVCNGVAELLDVAADLVTVLQCFELFIATCKILQKCNEEVLSVGLKQKHVDGRNNIKFSCISICC